MGNCLFLRARGWGIDRQVRKKLQIPGGGARGGMVTRRIEPCISLKVGFFWFSSKSNTYKFFGNGLLTTDRDGGSGGEIPILFCKKISRQTLLT